MRITGRFQVSILCCSISHLLTVQKPLDMSTISTVGMILTIALHLCPVHPRPTQVVAPDPVFHHIFTT